MSATTVASDRPRWLDNLRRQLSGLPGQSHFSAEELDLLYRMGCDLFDQGKYQQADRLFNLLILFRPLEARYLFACGMSQKAQKRPAMATQMFCAAMLLDPDNPAPVMETAECMLLLDARKDACDVLRHVLAIAGDSEAHAAVRERAVQWLAAMREQDRGAVA